MQVFHIILIIKMVMTSKIKVSGESYHVIHVKDDRFIGHGSNLSRPHPLKSQGHTALRGTAAPRPNPLGEMSTAS